MKQTDPQLVARVKALRQQGCTMQQIADEVGVIDSEYRGEVVQQADDMGDGAVWRV